MPSKRLSIGLRAILAVYAVNLFVTGAAASQEKVLHSFDNNGITSTARMVLSPTPA